MRMKLLRKLCLVTALLIVGSQVGIGAAHGQVGTPPEPLAQGGQALSEVSRVKMPPVDAEALLEEDQQRGEDQPLRFAKPIKVEINPETDGTWETLDDGTLLWRLRIQSPDAVSLSLGFGTYYMPPEGRLFLYTPDHNTVIGPFTAEDNEEHGQLWTPIIKGDTIVVEVQLPADAVPNLNLELISVNHGYTDVSSELQPQSVKSGACNVDVVCPEGDDWRDEIPAVGRYVFSGGYLCSGALVNNTAQDLTPYFLTANHCITEPAVAPTMVVYWNYENSTCRSPGSPESGQPGDGSLSQNQSGAIFRALYEDSDFALVELDDQPDAAFDLYWLGWDRTDAGADSAVCIHHPRGHEKRISFENDPVTVTSYDGTSVPGDGTHIRVEDWDLGTTEGGSSGSPLFNPDHRVIGQLHGGDAACGNDESDWFGRFHISWTGGGTDSSRLSNWLDPCNIGATTLDGTDTIDHIALGLCWLRTHQNPDGSWLNDVGVTSLAALAFLNHGYDENDPDVQKAIQYILSHVHADGSIYTDSSHKTYNTSLAVLPLKATQNSDYADEIEAARDWLVNGQWDDDCLWDPVNEDNWYWGGFGYGNHSRPDLSNSQFALLALDAADLPKSDPLWDKALTFVSRCQNRQASNDGFSPHDDGGFIYHPGSYLSPDAASYGSITGAGIWGLALAGKTPSDDRFDAALEWVTDNYTWEYNPLTDGSWGDTSLYYYYMSMSKALSMARTTRIGGHDWYRQLSEKLVDLQRSDGSWVNSNSWLRENQPELVTSYALLALQTRQLPRDADLEMVIILHSPADLHLYDAEGRHVGKDYGNGGVDLEIPGSSYSADDPQTISIHPPVAGNYHLELVGTGEGDWEVEIIGLQDGVQVNYDSYTGSITPGTVLATGLNVGAFEGSLTIFSAEPEVAPLLEVSPTSLLMIGEPGETLRSSFVISETQGSQAVEDISIFASDLTGAEGVIAAADIGLEPAGVASLPAGTSQAISVTVPLGVGLPGGTYNGTIVVESINAGAKGIDLSVGIPTPTMVDVTTSRGQIAPGGENSTITAEVRDQWGNPIRDGTVVSFTTSLGTIAPATDTTVGGVASSVLTSGDTEGTATVTAVAESADGTAAVAFGLPVGGATFFHVWTSLLVPWVGLVALAGLMLMGTIVAIRKRKS